MRQQRQSIHRVVVSAVGAVVLTTLITPIGCTGTNVTNTTSTTTDTGTVDASNYKGSVSGTASDTRSTRDSTTADGSTAAGQTLPLGIATAGAVLYFEDLQGNPLRDGSGNPYPPVNVADGGEFTADNLPVGVDFVIAVDLDGDGSPDIRQIVQIPADASGDAGSIANVVIDPLSTLIVAKLRELFANADINPMDLEISPMAVVHRIVDAYIHLFEESGIDSNVTLADIVSLDDATLEDLFMSLIPPTARVGFDTVEGNLAIAGAKELEPMVIAAAEVFVRAGFPIADGPDGMDLSFLGDLDGVEVKSIEEFYNFNDFMPGEEPIIDEPLAPAQVEDSLTGDPALDELLNAYLAGESIDDILLANPELEPLLADYLVNGSIDGSLDPALEELIYDIGTDTDTGTADSFPNELPTIYISTVSEPDRNFIGEQDFENAAAFQHLPIIDEYLLIKMAEWHLEGRVITLANLYRLLTDADVGFGARLTYNLPGFFDGPPMMYFETADGRGIAKDVDAIFMALETDGLTDPGTDLEQLQTQEDSIRLFIRDLLTGTVPPSFDRLFGAFAGDRIVGVEQLTGFIREAKAHLPFNRSGPSTFFVIADGNAYDPNVTTGVNAVTVDIAFDDGGLPLHVTYNPNSQGRYLLGFTYETDEFYIVEPIVRETGRWMHDPHGGPLFLNMGDTTLFQAVNGVSFIDFVSESGTFYPGIPVSMRNPDYEFGIEVVPTEGDLLLEPAVYEEAIEADINLYVLATAPGPEGQPVRVNYDPTTDIFTYDPNGRYYVTFLPESETTGLFELFDIDLNIFPTVQDLGADRFIDTQVVYEEDYYLDPTLDPNYDSTLDSTLDPTLDSTTALTVDPAEIVTDSTTDPLTDPTLDDPTIGFYEPALIRADEIVGLTVSQEFFNFVYGTETPNANFDLDANPYFDDANGNGEQDAGEFTSDHRPTLFDPRDWRSTDIPRYYRRASGGGISFDNVDFESTTPRTLDGEDLVARNFRPRHNAFRFGRPNTAINLLTAFMRPESFDGTHALNENTELGIFQAVALINLVMEQVFNIKATFDIDGDGPLREATTLTDAQLFVLPIRDPFMLLLKGFDSLAVIPVL